MILVYNQPSNMKQTFWVGGSEPTYTLSGGTFQKVDVDTSTNESYRVFLTEPSPNPEAGTYVDVAPDSVVFWPTKSGDFVVASPNTNPTTT